MLKVGKDRHPERRDNEREKTLTLKVAAEEKEENNGTLTVPQEPMISTRRGKEMIRKLSNDALQVEGKEIVGQLDDTIEIMGDMKKIVYEFVHGKDIDLKKLKQLLLGFEARVSNIEGAFANIFRSARDS